MIWLLLIAVVIGGVFIAAGIDDSRAAREVTARHRKIGGGR